MRLHEGRFWYRSGEEVLKGRSAILLDTTGERQVQTANREGQGQRTGELRTLSNTLAKLVGKSTEKTMRITSLSG